MRIKIKYFGLFQEIVGKSEEELQLENSQGTEELAQLLKDKYNIKEELSFRLAVNHALIKGNSKLEESDEVAVLPAFAGG